METDKNCKKNVLEATVSSYGMQLESDAIHKGCFSLAIWNKEHKQKPFTPYSIFQGKTLLF